MSFTDQDTVHDSSIKKRRTEEAIASLRMMDDVFMRCVLRDNTPLVEHILRILLGDASIVLADSKTQYDLSRPGLRGATLDVWAIGVDGTLYDWEVQRRANDDEKRIRYYGGLLDVDQLKPSEAFGKLPNRWVLYLAEYDKLGMKLPMYFLWPREDLAYDDGTRIALGNASYRGNDELGRMMADLCEPDPEKISDPMLRRWVRYYKVSQEGRQAMSAIMDELLAEERKEARKEALDEGRKQGVLESLRALLASTGWTDERACDALGVPASDRPAILAALHG